MQFRRCLPGACGESTLLCSEFTRNFGDSMAVGVYLPLFCSLLLWTLEML